jgi:hypothetical protein
MKEPGSDGGNITMTQCQNTPGSREMVCNYPPGHQSQILWQNCGGVWCWYLRFLQLSDDLSWGLRYAISKHVVWNKRQFWNKDRKSVCTINTDYKGNNSYIYIVLSFKQIKNKDSILIYITATF